MSKILSSAPINKFFAGTNVFDEEKEKVKLIEHLDSLKNMDVKEQILYQKWYELTHKYSISNNKVINRSSHL